MKFLYEESTNAKKWLKTAKEDLKLARLGEEHPEIHYEPFCYHCQQAVEKSLKALLIFKIGRYPKTHSFDELIKYLEESNIAIPDDIKKEILSSIAYGGQFIPFGHPLANRSRKCLLSYMINHRSIVTLNDHAEKNRYPTDHEPIDVNAYKQSLKKAGLIIEWVEQQIQIEKL